MEKFTGNNKFVSLISLRVLWRKFMESCNS